MRLQHCHNFADFRKLSEEAHTPIFHYIDGAADDEDPQNTEAFDGVDLVPNVRRCRQIMSVTVMGQKLDMPIYCAPAALQRLFHHEGEAVAKAATKIMALCLEYPHSQQLGRRLGR